MAVARAQRFAAWDERVQASAERSPDDRGKCTDLVLDVSNRMNNAKKIRSTTEINLRLALVAIPKDLIDTIAS